MTNKNEERVWCLNVKKKEGEREKQLSNYNRNSRHTLQKEGSRDGEKQQQRIVISK